MTSRKHHRVHRRDALLFAAANLDRDWFDPAYAAISMVLTPLFRRRLEEKFDRGADPDLRRGNQATYVAYVAYVALVSLDATSIRTEDGDTPLEPRMAVTTEIKTGKRTVIGYLLSPLLRLKQEGLRER